MASARVQVRVTSRHHGNAQVTQPGGAPQYAGFRRVTSGSPAALRRDVEACASASLQASVRAPRGGAVRAGSTRVCAVARQGAGKFVVGGNWKCNGTNASITQLVHDLNAGAVDTATVQIIVAPPTLYLNQVKDSIDKQKFAVSAQNCWVYGGGAYTGEVCAEMLADAKVPWVILGHSERRALCGESDEFVGKKVAHALEQGLCVMACIGETLEEREAGATLSVCTRQLQAIVDQISTASWAKVVIAYEPVWAIGTGKVATPQQAQDVHAGIRAFVAQAVSPAVATAVRIQYGGSVNPGNCKELARMEDIDGFLVGGASLKGDDFITICNAATESVPARV